MTTYETARARVMELREGVSESRSDIELPILDVMIRKLLSRLTFDELE